METTTTFEELRRKYPQMPEEALRKKIESGERYMSELSDEDRNQMIKQYQNGEKGTKLCARYNINVNSFRSYAKKHGIMSNPKLSEAIKKAKDKNTETKQDASFSIKLSGIKICLNLAPEMNVQDIDVTNNEISLTVK